MSSDSCERAFHRLTQIMGCKWSLGILDAIDRDICRPSAIERELDGISPKVLHRCIHRLEQEGFLVRQAYDEIPPRVEYRFTEDGLALHDMIMSVRELASRWHTRAPMSLESELGQPGA